MKENFPILSSLSADQKCTEAHMWVFNDLLLVAKKIKKSGFQYTLESLIRIHESQIKENKSKKKKKKTF